MSSTSTQERASDALNKIVEREPHGYKIDTDVQKKFIALCELADVLDGEFNAEGVQINIEPSGVHGVVFVDVYDVVFEYGRTHRFFELVKSADFLSFSKTKSGMLRISFGVKDLWVRS